ncbi:zinc finger X-linked protein ZXDB-like [Nannospalax galili]|uniref:zinc finger X-linked protein ZXDB-like n=1 Tax=Nannospalax galili TaxID=1026970 RepID=UPI0004ED1B50|nr:zinc finger X-linked protein ZXDB-like [Nannospalax galili]
MEIPRQLPARGTPQGGGGGGGGGGGTGGVGCCQAGGGRVHPGPGALACQAPTRRLLLLRGAQDGGPGRSEEAQRASRGPAAALSPSPSLLTPRHDHPSGGGGSHGDDFFLLLLNPVGGDVETAGTDQAGGPVWREEAEAGLGPERGERGANPAGRTEPGPRYLSPARAPLPCPAPALGPAAAFAGTVTIRNQDLFLSLENGALTLTTPPLPAWEPGVAPVPQVRGPAAPQAGFPPAVQLCDCPEVPPDLLLAEPAEPASAPAPAPEEEAEARAAAQNPPGPLVPGPGVVLYLCPEAQCGQTFAKKHQLKVHLLTHSSSQGQRPFKCPLSGCGWTFTTSYKLKRHLQSHDKLRPFGCPVEGCGKSFTTVYNLKAHMKGHEQENSFKCEVCEESFPTQAKLSTHQRSHFEPERPYQCAFSGCKKTFITVSALFSHNRAHFREQELFSYFFLIAISQSCFHRVHFLITIFTAVCVTARVTQQLCLHQMTFFRKLIQQPGESFTDFLAQVTGVVEWREESGTTQDMLVKYLAWEGLNTPTRSAIAPVCNDDIHKWVLATRGLDPKTGPIKALAVSLEVLLLQGRPTSSDEKYGCWNCGRTGHLCRDCLNNGAHPKTCCPKCKKGFHWAKICRSWPQSESAPLNSTRGAPQPHKRGNETGFMDPSDS